MSSSSKSFESPKTAVPTLEEDLEPKKIVDGIYILLNKATRLVIDLAGGSSNGGTKCNGQMYQYGEDWKNTVWRVRQDGPENTFSIIHLRAGTALDLSGGKRDVHVEGHGYSRNNGNQQWIIEEDAGYHTIQSPNTQQYLGVKSLDPGTAVVCSSFDAGDEQRLWEFERISRTAEEIANVVIKWDDSLSRRLSFPYGGDGQYFVLPSVLRKAVWEKTGIPRQRLRKSIFDFDDFVIKMKQASNEWARDNFKLDGYSALCGVIFGQGAQGPTAYNWYLSSDMQSLIMFDAQTGREFTTPALEGIFTPSFGIF